MAQLRLRRQETFADRLPEVCMACGQPSTTHIRKQFAWHPPWVIITIFAGLLIYVILALVLTKRMTVDVPVCDRHRGYWVKRGLWMFGAFAALVFLCIAAGVGLDAALGNDAPGLICGMCAISLVAWLIFALVLQSQMIKVKEITDRTITLSKVNADFVAAFVGMRDDDFDDEDDLPRRPRRKDYDESPPEPRESFRERQDHGEPRQHRHDDYDD